MENKVIHVGLACEEMPAPVFLELAHRKLQDGADQFQVRLYDCLRESGPFHSTPWDGDRDLVEAFWRQETGEKINPLEMLREMA